MNPFGALFCCDTMLCLPELSLCNKNFRFRLWWHLANSAKFQVSIRPPHRQSTIDVGAQTVRQRYKSAHVSILADWRVSLVRLVREI